MNVWDELNYHHHRRPDFRYYSCTSECSWDTKAITFSHIVWPKHRTSCWDKCTRARFHIQECRVILVEPNNYRFIVYWKHKFYRICNEWGWQPDGADEITVVIWVRTSGSRTVWKTVFCVIYIFVYFCCFVEIPFHPQRQPSLFCIIQKSFLYNKLSNGNTTISIWVRQSQVSISCGFLCHNAHREYGGSCGTQWWSISRSFSLYFMHTKMCSIHLQWIRFAQDILPHRIPWYLALVEITANIVHRHEGLLARNVFAFDIHVCVWWWSDLWRDGRCWLHKGIISVLRRHTK